MIEIKPVTDDLGTLVGADWLPRAEAVHRQLRPQLERDYPAQMRALFAAGARMAVAVEGEAVRGVMVWRLLLKTHSGREIYIDDLVTDAATRSRGIGRALLAFAEARARLLGCSLLNLDSGTQRQQAHKFYFREDMTITSFHFAKQI
jgi:GNAT superfamily N-acetyltransferase